MPDLLVWGGAGRLLSATREHCAPDESVRQIADGEACRAALAAGADVRAVFVPSGQAEADWAVELLAAHPGIAWVLLDDDPRPDVVRQYVEDGPWFAMLRPGAGAAELRQLLHQIRSSASTRLDSRTGAPVGIEPLEDYLLMIAHDLRAPLSLIAGYANLLHTGLVDAAAEHRDNLTRLRRTVARCVDLVDGLLRLAMVEAGLAVLEPAATSPGDLIREVLADLEPLAIDKRQTIEARVVPPGSRQAVWVDRHLLWMVLRNLISNAIKYTGNGGTIGIEARVARDVVRFSIRDSGPGLSADQVRLVFEKYTRFAQEVPAPGAGLGLWAAKKVIELHNGSIGVVSRPGEGSTFTFSVKTFPPKGRSRG